MIKFRTNKPEISIKYSNTNQIELKFIAPKIYADEIESLKDDIVVEIKNYYKKRTLSQNAYFWAMVQEIAERNNLSNIDVYKRYIKDFGVYEVIPIKKEAVETFIAKWEKNGIGWFVENLRESKLSGYQNLLVYFGSSSYNTKEMTRLMEAVIQDCNELGITILGINDFVLLENNN